MHPPVRSATPSTRARTRALARPLVLALALALGACADTPRAPTVHGVSVDQPAPSVAVGASVALTATVAAEAGADTSVAWTSGDEAIASIDPATGVATGHALGQVDVTARSTVAAEHADTVTLTVLAAHDDAPSEVALEPNAIVGTLVDAQGAPMPGVHVSARLTAVASVGSDVADASAARAAPVGAASVGLADARGVFRLPVDAAGSYAITALDDAMGAFATVSVVEADDGELVAAEVVRLTAAPYGAVSGSVTGASGGVFVFALGTSIVATTDDLGRFVLTRVPAGTHRVAAGLPGATSAPIAVTVTPGEVTLLEQAIVVGPTVTAVDPPGIRLAELDDDVYTTITWPHTFEIVGHGFGRNQGLSRLRYANANADTSVLSWSDERIVVSTELLRRSLPGFPLEALRDMSRDAFRFEVITATGSARSEPVMLVSRDAFHILPSPPRTTGHSEVNVRVREAIWLVDVAVEFQIEVENGVALDAHSDDVIDRFTTRSLADPHGTGSGFRLLRTSGLPLVATLRSIEHPQLSTAVHDHLGTVATLDETAYPAGAITLTGTLIGWDGAPFETGLEWVMVLQEVVSLDPLELAPIPEIPRTEVTVGAEGAFHAPVEVPASYEGRTLRAHIAYVVYSDRFPQGRGFRYLATADFTVDGSPAAAH